MLGPGGFPQPVVVVDDAVLDEKEEQEEQEEVEGEELEIVVHRWASNYGLPGPLFSLLPLLLSLPPPPAPPHSHHQRQDAGLMRKKRPYCSDAILELLLVLSAVESRAFLG